MQKEAHLGIGGELVMPEDCLADRSLHTWVKAPVRDWERNPAIIITHPPRLTIVLAESELLLEPEPTLLSEGLQPAGGEGKVGERVCEFPPFKLSLIHI